MGGLELDKLKKLLFIVCFILAGSVAFTTGMLFKAITTQNPFVIPSNNTINNTSNGTSPTDTGTTQGTGDINGMNKHPGTNRPPGAAPGHQISGPVRYTYSDIEDKWIAWYYDEDVGQEFSECEAWDPNAGCYHD